MTFRRREPGTVLWPDQDGVEQPAQSPTGPDGVVPQPVGPAPRPVLLRLRTWVGAGVGAVLAVQVGWVLALALADRPTERALSRSEMAPVASAGPPGERSTVPQPAPDPAPQSAGAAQAVSRARAGRPTPADLAGWAERMSPRVGIPPVALAAYGNAERVLAAEDPGCHLSWVAVAGIGRVESDHGRFGGAVLQPDGRSKPSVIGIALDGNGGAAIRDSDAGRLDGDPVHDRAVGPMQFIPTTWARYAADGDRDGVADPFALPDAALAAGRYLCRAGQGDLRTAGPWTSAVLAYNASTSYLRRVTEAGNGYASASFG